MNRAEFPTFLTSLDQVAEVLGTTLSARKKEGYWFSLQDLSLDAFQGACLAAMRDETFFPVPAIFRAYAKEWQQKHKRLQEVPADERHLLSLREELVPAGELRALLASVWPEEYRS